jgi:hypothetical protein
MGLHGTRSDGGSGESTCLVYLTPSSPSLEKDVAGSGTGGSVMNSSG